MSDQDHGIPSGTPDPGAAGVSTVAMAAGTLSIGSVFGQSFSVLFRSFVKFIVVTAILWVPSILFSIYFLGASTATSGGVVELGAQGPAAFGFAVVMAVAATVMYGAVIHITCLTLADRPAGVGAAIGKGFARFFPLFIAYILLSILVTIGLILLIAPGFWILATYALVLPAIVAENKGPFAGMGRSAALTKGYRWKVLGASILLFVLIIAISFVTQFIVGFLAAVGGAGDMSAILIVTVTITSLFQIVIYLYMLIFYTTLYHQIRAAKEGASADEIAAVFD